MIIVFIYISQIYWNDTGTLVCIASEKSYYILQYNSQALTVALTNRDLMTDDGIEDTFDVSFISLIIR